MINNGLFTSNSEEYSTSQDFFDELNKEFSFNLDVCATKDNTKCLIYYDKQRDGLKQSWDGYNIFMNPPYGSVIKDWIKKASEARGGVVVCLLPARTDTRYFHEYIYQKPGVEIRFIKGRLKFGGLTNSAPFPSMLVIFR